MVINFAWAKVQIRVVLNNWPANPAPAKICQESSPMKCVISLDSVEVSWTQRQMLIYETLVWAVRLSSFHHWPSGKASCYPLISSSLHTLCQPSPYPSVSRFLISDSPSASDRVPSFIRQCAFKSPGELAKIQTLIYQVWGGAWNSFLTRPQVTLTLIIRGTHFESQASRQADRFLRLPIWSICRKFR